MASTRIAAGLLGAAAGLAVALAGQSGADSVGDDWPAPA